MKWYDQQHFRRLHSLHLLLHHSSEGNFAVRKGKCKLILCPGSGGWTAPKDSEAIEEGLPGIQLYNMKTDIRERENVYAEHPYVVRKLLRMLIKTVEGVRSTRGIDLINDIEDIDIWKGKSFVVIEK